MWMGLSDPQYSSWRNLSAYIFLVFAQLVWPVWVPFSILCLKKNNVRKKVLRILLVIGVIISVYLMYCMLTHRIETEMRNEHIHYSLNFPLAFAWISGVFYFIPTVLPLFVSSVKRMWLLGVVTFLSFVFTKIYFTENFISVWCFFAAGISVMIYGFTTAFRKDPVLG